MFIVLFQSLNYHITLKLTLVNINNLISNNPHYTQSNFIINMQINPKNLKCNNFYKKNLTFQPKK